MEVDLDTSRSLKSAIRPGDPNLKNSTTEAPARAIFNEFFRGIRLESHSHGLGGGLPGGDESPPSFKLPFLSEEQTKTSLFRERDEHDASRTTRTRKPEANLLVSGARIPF